jgi:hypothetical protein
MGQELPCSSEVILNLYDPVVGLGNFRPSATPFRFSRVCPPRWYLSSPQVVDRRSGFVLAIAGAPRSSAPANLLQFFDLLNQLGAQVNKLLICVSFRSIMGSVARSP